MSAFSRLQLAAALLEYDNDPEYPSSLRKAQDSAIFAHVRTRNAPRARTLSGFEHLRETPNLLGVDLPIGDAGSGRGSMDARHSLAGTRNSRGSIDVLRNPFGEDIPESEQDAEDEASAGEDLEVDLEAWGMADYLGKEKEKQKSRNRRSAARMRQPSKTHSEMLPNHNHSSVYVDEFGQFGGPTRRPPGTRSKSISGLGAGSEHLDLMRQAPVASEADFRRRSLGAPLDSAGRQTPDFERPLSTAGLSQPLANRAPLRNHPLGTSPHTIPFPSSSPAPGEENEDPNLLAIHPTSQTSKFALHGRTMSSGSFGSQMVLDQARARTPSVGAAVLEENPFALRPPSPSRTSRFDPKAAASTRRMSSASLEGRSMLDAPRERTMSTATAGTPGFMDDNPFSLPPPSPTRTSRFDPKAAVHARTVSSASFGSRLPPDIDRMSMTSGQVFEQDTRQSRRYSKMELMRPKVLVMPSPLQGTEQAEAPPQLPPGFHLTTVGPPLPPGVQGRPVSHAFSSTGGLQVPVASNSFTPNPRTSMSLSQLTFRNSLMVGGQRDVAYEDIEVGLRRAQEDGEQIYQEEDIEEEIAEEQKQAQGRAPGKLYGRSLMDELQARKDKMRSKQRVFTGDERPSMMSRGQVRRRSTLIDPASLQERPPSQNFGDRPPLARRGSSGHKPLLDFSGEPPTSPAAPNSRVPNSKSVFGVDQLWERELARLKEIEAAEKVEEEERQRVEEAKMAAKKAKGKNKNKSKAVKAPSPEPVEALPRPSLVSDLPPTLPAIQKATARRPRAPIVDYDDSESDSEASESAAIAKAAQRKLEVNGWESSDDERRPKPARHALESDSEDDVPLARQIPAIRAPSSDSEDEKPLAKVLERKSLMPDVNFNDIFGEKHTLPTDEEEDDTPLGVRHPHAQSIIARSTVNGDDGDDDEKPLGLKQAQQQQMQYNMAAQQQMMMEAQLRNSMAFGAPSMLGAFSPFMVPPQAFGTAPPAADIGKYHSVDKWRHNVAAE